MYTKALLSLVVTLLACTAVTAYAGPMRQGGGHGLAGPRAMDLQRRTERQQMRLERQMEGGKQEECGRFSTRPACLAKQEVEAKNPALSKEEKRALRRQIQDARREIYQSK